MKSVFISYRHDDTQDAAFRLGYNLRQDLGDTQVFVDQDRGGISPGRNFHAEIKQALESCKVMLVLIGVRWLTGVNGNRRLNDPEDFVRLEIQLAMQRGIPVIPVLLNGAAIPPKQDLPDELRDFADFHAIEVTTSRWQFDVNRLTEAVRPHLNMGWKNGVAGSVSVAGGALGGFLANRLAAYILVPVTGLVASQAVVIGG